MASSPPPVVIGYYNGNSYPVSFSGPNNAPISLASGEPLLCGSYLVTPNRHCDHLVLEGILRSVLEGDKRFIRFAPGNKTVAASAKMMTEAEINQLPAKDVKVSSNRAPAKRLIPESTISSTNGVIVTLPSGAEKLPDGKITYNGMTFANDMAFTAYMKSNAGTEDGITP